MHYECEAKLRVDSLDAIGIKLNRLGATSEGGGLERNWVLDAPDGRLEKSGTLLRVRTLGGPGAVLTVKRPVEGGEFKTREEVETMVDSADDLLRQLEAVGFGVKWIYEKHRRTWLWRDSVIALDLCPEMGSFVEIEGTPATIREVAAELDLDPDEHINDNYLGLWFKYLEKRGQARRNMVFAEADRPAST